MSEHINFSYPQTDPEAKRLMQQISARLHNDTMLVEALLKQDVGALISYDDVQNLMPLCDEDCEKDCEGDHDYQEIYQWAAYYGYDSDMEKLAEKGFPVIISDYGNWIGLTSFGSSWDIYVIPSICNALFNN